MKTARRATLLFVVIFALAVTACRVSRNRSVQPETTSALPPVATFSIVAYDADTGELGIAVQSKFIAVGAVVPWAKADIGAIATQAWANTTFGPGGLKQLAAGEAPEEVLKRLLAEDPRREHRQVGMVDAKGRVAGHTGSECLAWAGHKLGENYTVQGNILAGEEVVEAMARAYEEADGDLGDRMILALSAGQEAGGDRRGRQSAALLIVRNSAGYGGFNDRYRDVRVDDHPAPIKELRRVYELHKKIFPPPKRRDRRSHPPSPAENENFKQDGSDSKR